MLKIQPKISLLLLRAWPFPQEASNGIADLCSHLKPSELGKLLDTFNPYPTRIEGVLASLPQEEGFLSYLPSSPSGLHISVIASEGNGSEYSGKVTALMCYPVADKPGRNLGPKSFRALVWCTLKVELDMTGKIQLEPRGSSNFHITFAMIGITNPKNKGTG
jgi:hypothetical protein